MLRLAWEVLVALLTVQVEELIGMWAMPALVRRRTNPTAGLLGEPASDPPMHHGPFVSGYTPRCIRGVFALTRPGTVLSSRSGPPSRGHWR